MKFKLFLIILILLNSSSVLSVQITEIMYNPVGSDNGHEWIEIYSNQPINISGWTFKEGGSNHKLTLINGSWLFQGYAVIADEALNFLQDYPYFNGTLFDSSWSSLSNSGELLELNNGSDIIDSVNYDSVWSIRDGSLEKLDFINNISDNINWLSSLNENGTPGKQNSVFDSCDWKIELLSENNWYDLSQNNLNKTTLSWKINTSNIYGTGRVNFSYWVEDVFGNIIKSPLEKSTNQSDIFGAYRKTLDQPGGYLIKTEIIDSSCYDVNENNDIATMPTVVSGALDNSQIESKIEIEAVTPKEINFGDVVNAKINVYRGDTRKYSLKLSVEDTGRKISETTTVHILEKFSQSRLTIPIKIKENCAKKTGAYDLVIEGLDLSENKKIKISENLNCGQKISKPEVEKKELLELIDVPNIVNSNDVSFSVNINNDKKENLGFKVWAYVYRGSRCYSCSDNTQERDNLAQEISVDGKVTGKLNFNLQLDEKIENGEYNLKIKSLQDGQKTEKEITAKINVLVPEKQEKLESIPIAAQKNEANQTNLLTGQVIYESSSAKAGNLIPVVLIIAFLLLGIVVVKEITLKRHP